MKRKKQHRLFDPVDETPTDPGPVDEDAVAEVDDTLGEHVDEASDAPAEDAAEVSEVARADAESDDPFAGSAFFADDDAAGGSGPEDSASTEITADAHDTGVVHDPGQDAVDAFFGPRPVERTRPERPPLIPRWVWIAIASAAGVVVLAIFGFVFARSLVSIEVPQLVGVDVGTARTRLAVQHLALAVTERRFSTTPADTVLSQDPAPGTKLKDGQTVNVIVSAGTEQFSMPNVVNDGLLLARGLLEARGLEVRVEPTPSQLPSDTVLASNPPAGSSVHTGDLVRLSVAASGTAAALLLPYDLTGVTVVIDPAPVNDAQTDVPLDVARRLRSLVEASKGIVVATRALSDTSTLDAVPARAKRASTTTATVAVGLMALPTGASGLTIYSPSPVLAYASASARLASRITSDLAAEAGTVRSATSTTDTVLAAARAPWTRVQLGAYSNKEDVSRFSDPAWEDSVARGLYRAIAALYGKKLASP